MNSPQTIILINKTRCVFIFMFMAVAASAYKRKSAPAT